MTNDIYRSHAGEITDALLADPDLFTPVDREFAEASDSGYGQWSDPAAGDEPDALGEESGPGGIPGTDAAHSRLHRALSADEQADLDELDQMMSRPQQPLLAATGRGAYVDPGAADDDQTDTAEPPPSATESLTPPDGSGPRFRLDWSRRGHRIGAIAAAAAGLALVASIALPRGGDDRGSAPTAPSASPDFSVPTVVESSPPPPPTAAAADGPVGIKRADSRCTAGSTDPKNAFDNDLNTAWMCVPAYGVPGTVLRVEFDNWYVVTGVSIVPGWNRVNPDGSDEWIKHKTAATVEYQFNDPEETRFTQQTNSIRDEVFTPVQPPVLASAMTITITEFGTPTGAVANTTSLPGGGGIIASDTPVTGDLKDFAISQVNILGHRAN